MNSDKKIGAFLLSLSEAFPGSVKSATLSVYLDELRPRLQDVDLDVVRSKLIESCDFFPTVKRIIEVVKSRKEVERAQAYVRELQSAENEKYVNVGEFFKNNGVANFTEYYEKLKKSRGQTT